MKRKILILGFGGTIAMVPDKDGVLKPAKSIGDILNIVPSLQEQADLSFEQLENLDSTNINSTHWKTLANKIFKEYQSFDGIIVTHGTDTMAYTAGAISLSFGGNLPIPVVFTGSQLPLVSFGADSRFNLENSVKTVLVAIEKEICEVMIVFGDRVMRGSRAIKTSEAKFTAFDSPAFPYLAQITAIGVEFNALAMKKKSHTSFELKANFHRGILAIDLVPGLEPNILSQVIKSGLCAGVLLKSFGAGNVPSEGDYSLIPVIEETVNRYKVPILVSTKFVGGNTHLDLYEPGKLALEAGAIPTGDMTDIMAQVKLMWALGQKNYSISELSKVINTDIAGEITN